MTLLTHKQFIKAKHTHNETKITHFIPLSPDLDFSVGVSLVYFAKLDL